MIVYKVKPIETKVIDDIVCDKCCSSCKYYLPGTKEDYIFEYSTLAWDWGYWSSHDEERGQMELCEKCWGEIVGKKRDG